MENFESSVKTHIVFGRNAENEVGSLIKQCGGRRVLLVFGMRSALQHGLIDRVRLSMDRAGIDYEDLGDIGSSPHLERVMEGVSACREQRLDFILAVGANPVVDAAKSIAAGFYCRDDADIWELFLKGQNVPRALPVGVIMTKNGAGSEIAGIASLCGRPDSKGRWLKLYSRSPWFQPAFAVLNPELSESLSLEQTATGIVSICSCVLSIYMGGAPATPLNDSLAEAVLRTVCDVGYRLRSNPADYDLRANLMWAGTLSHSLMLSGGSSADPTLQVLEQCLSGFYRTSSGRTLAVILPAWMEFLLNKRAPRWAQLASNVFSLPVAFHDLEATARHTLDSFRAFFNGFGLPCNLNDLGGSAADIPEILDVLEHYIRDAGPEDFDAADRHNAEAILSLAACYRK